MRSFHPSCYVSCARLQPLAHRNAQSLAPWCRFIRVCAPQSFHNVSRVLKLTDCARSEWTLIELQIAGAYVRLSSIPADSPAASVSLASAGSCEIRMVRGPEVGLDGVPLFWLELFDHSTKTSLDSCCCHRIKDAVFRLQEFMLQAGASNNHSDMQG